MFITSTFTICNPVTQIRRLTFNCSINNQRAIWTPEQIEHFQTEEHSYLNVPFCGASLHNSKDSSDPSGQLLRPLHVDLVEIHMVPSLHMNMSSLSQFLSQLSSSDMSKQCGKSLQSQESGMQAIESSHWVTPVLFLHSLQLAGCSSYQSSQLA